MTPTRGAALYVLVEVTDDQLVSDSTNTWDDDGIELFIDADNSKKTGYGRNDFQYSVRWNGSLSEFKQSATANVTMAQSQTASGHVVELTLPWTTLKGTPGAGAFIGLDVHVNDDDNGGGCDGKLAWFGTTDNAWQTPKALANAKLDDLVGTGLTGQYFASTYFATLRLTRLRRSTSTGPIKLPLRTFRTISSLSAGPVL